MILAPHAQLGPADHTEPVSHVFLSSKLSRAPQVLYWDNVLPGPAGVQVDLLCLPMVKGLCWMCSRDGLGRADNVDGVLDCLHSTWSGV